MKKIRFILIPLILFLIFSISAQAAPQESVPVAVVFMLNRSAQMVNSNKTEEAIKLLEEFQAKAGKVSPKAASRKGYLHYLIDATLGNYHLLLSRPEKAICCYNAALKKKKDLSEAWLNLGKCFYDTGRMKKAGESFLKGYETAGQKKGIYLYYSSAGFMMADDFSRALSVFRRLLKAHPEEIELSWKETLAQIFFSLEKYKEALPYIEELAEKHTGKKKKEWQEILLSQYILLQMDKKALSYAKWLTRIDTLEPKWWKALCNLHLSNDSLREGLASMLIYSFLTPLSDEENELLADLFMMLEIPAKAVEHYRLLAENDSSTGTFKKLAGGCLRMHDPEEALLWIEKGLKLEEDADLILLKGNLLFESGRYQEAVAVFKKGTRQKKISGRSTLMLGYTYWNLGKTLPAEKAFQKAATFKKEKKQAQNALKQLKKATRKG